MAPMMLHAFNGCHRRFYWAPPRTILLAATAIYPDSVLLDTGGRVWRVIALREIRVQDPGQDKICGARISYRAQVRRVPGLLTASRCAAVAVRAAQTRPKPS